MGSLLTAATYMPTAIPLSLGSKECLLPLNTSRMVRLRAATAITEDELPTVEAYEANVLLLFPLLQGRHFHLTLRRPPSLPNLPPPLLRRLSRRSSVDRRVFPFLNRFTPSRPISIRNLHPTRIRTPRPNLIRTPRAQNVQTPNQHELDRCSSIKTLLRSLPASRQQPRLIEIEHSSTRTLTPTRSWSWSPKPLRSPINANSAYDQHL